jgi:uncharacterized protein
MRDPVTEAAWADPDARQYWAALSAGHLIVRRCERCGRSHLPPMPSCPHCGHSEALRDVLSTGIGRVYSWVVAYYAFSLSQQQEVPYVLAAVDLDDGVRVFGQLSGVDLDGNLDDMEVVARPERGRDGGLPVLIFVPTRKVLS